MTIELKEALERELATALESGDPKQIDKALVNSNRAVISCQQKMAERVKLIAKDHPMLVSDVKEIKSIVENAKRTAWQIGFNAVKWIVLGGGATEFVRWLVSR